MGEFSAAPGWLMRDVMRAAARVKEWKEGRPKLGVPDKTKWKCPDCKRVQHGHRFICEQCGHNFGTVPETK